MLAGGRSPCLPEEEMMQIVERRNNSIEQNIYCVSQRLAFFFSIVSNKSVQIHSLENINNGDLFEAGHNLEGWISTADQRLLLRKHTTWNSNKRADGDLTQSHPIVFAVQSNSGGQKVLVKSGVNSKFQNVWGLSPHNSLESHIDCHCSTSLKNFQENLTFSLSQYLY